MGNLCVCCKTPETLYPTNVESNKKEKVKGSCASADTFGKQLPKNETEAEKTTEVIQSNYTTNKYSRKPANSNTASINDTLSEAHKVNLLQPSEQLIVPEVNEEDKVEVSNTNYEDNRIATLVKSACNLPDCIVSESGPCAKINKEDEIHATVPQKQKNQLDEVNTDHSNNQTKVTLLLSWIVHEDRAQASCSKVNIVQRSNVKAGQENPLREVLNKDQSNPTTADGFVDYIETERTASFSKTNKTLKIQTKTPDEKKNPLCEVKLVQPSSNILFLNDYIREYANSLNWEGDWASQSSPKFFRLDHHSYEYEDIEQHFNETNKRCFEVTQIDRVQNPYLLAAFLLKQEEMVKRIGYQDIEVLFHGTRNEHVMSICSNNFDWRLYGQNVGNKFGRGISFTPISNYATHYSDDTQSNRVMLVVHVLVGNDCVGSKDMMLPPDGFDTTIKPDGHVIVKYEDNEFYPAYKITYKCTNVYELEKRRYNNGQRGRPANNTRQFTRKNYN